jgi:hypothetical protein
LALSAAVLVPRTAAAQDYQSGYTFGIGVVLGQPAGVSMEFLLGAGHAIQAVVGFDMRWRDGLIFSANWLWHPLVITSTSAFDLSFHFGAGLYLGAWYDRRWGHGCDWDPTSGYHNCHGDEVGVGAHFPIGLDMFFKAVPVEVYIEIAPGFWFAPFIDWEIFGGLGGRYYF